MANKRIERSDLVAPNAITSVIEETVELEAQLTKILKINQELLKTNPLKSGSDIKKLNDDIQSVNTSSKALEETTKKLNEQTDEQIKEQIALQRARQEQKKALQDEVILSDKSAGTLQKLAAQSRKLRRERDGLNLETKKGTDRLKAINAQLDKNNAKIKENSDKLKQQKLNVGNYSASITQAVGEMGLFGGVIAKINQLQRSLTAAQTAYSTAVAASTTKLQLFKVALLSTGIGALLVALGSLAAAFQSSEEGQDKLSKGLKAIGVVVGNVSDVFAAFGEQLISFFSGEGFDSSKITEALDDLINKTKEEVAESNRLSDLIAKTNRLERELLVENAEIQAKIADLRLKARMEDEFTAAQRKKFLIEANELQDDLIIKELTIAKNRAEEIRIRNTFSKSTRENLEEEAAAQAKVFDVETKRLNQQRQIQRELNTVSKQQQAELNKQKKASDDLLNSIKDAESELDEDEDDAAFAAIQRETEILQAKRDIREDELAENQEYLDKLLEQTEEANQKKVEDEQKTAEELRKEREKAVDDAIAITNQIGDSLQTVSQKRLQSLDQETTKQAEELSRQERRAEQGLSNDLANQEKKAAELSRQREEEAKKAERTQKALAYFAQFQELSKENPNTAAFKAAANVAIAETIAGLFYDGAENIDDKTAHKWRNTGKDDFLIGVHGGERVLTATQNSKIGDISNEDLANIAVQYRTGNLGSVVPIMDDRVVSRLESVEKAVKNIHFDIYIDSDSNVTKTEFKNGLKKISTTKRKRLR